MTLPKIEEENSKKYAIRVGLGAIKAVGFNMIEEALKERENDGKFKNIYDFSQIKYGIYRHKLALSMQHNQLQLPSFARYYRKMPNTEKRQFFLSKTALFYERYPR